MESKTSRRRLATAERRRQAWQLRLSGMSQYEIARRLGVDQSTISDDVRHGLALYQRQMESEAAGYGRQVLARLEALFLAHWERAAGGDHRSAELCRRILADVRRMHGLDAPTRQQVEVSALPETPDELRRQLLQALGSPAGPGPGPPPQQPPTPQPGDSDR